MPPAILNKTLSCIQAEQGLGRFEHSFELVDELLRVYGEQNLAARLYEDISPVWDWSVVASLFGILIWSTSDNGHALTQETDRCLLEGTNLRRILIALHLDTFPFMERAQMEEVSPELPLIITKAAQRCNELIEQRRQMNA